MQEWSVRRRVESLRQMDRMLSDLGVGSRYTIWKEFGGGLCATEAETIEKWNRIAKNDALYANALFCYMVCTLEKYAISNIPDKLE